MRQLRFSAALAAQAGTRMLLSHSEGELTSQQRVAYICISVGLVIAAGLMSGLTLGLMSMDLVELEVLKRSGSPTEQRYAATIMPVVSNQHFLLVTLLLCNAVSMEALPLFLDRLADPVTAILLSVTAVLLLGEILPQAVCSKYGLAIGYYCAWLVRLLMALTSPISWPIGKLLDVLLGSEHRALFRRGQLKALVDIHGADEGMGGNLTEDEVKVICGALDLTYKTARKSMTPLNKVFMLPADARLNRPTMRAILASGHSRLPVFTSGDRTSIIGLILVKELLQYKTHQEVPVSDVRMRSLPRLPADTPMYDMLKLFQTGRSHMVVLTDTAVTAAAAAEAAAAAAAAEAAAEVSSTDGSSRSGTDSPLAMLRRGGRKGAQQKQQRSQFSSPLLQPLDSPKQLEQQGGPGSAWFASADQPGEQQQQPGDFGDATDPPSHLQQQAEAQPQGNGHGLQQWMREQELVAGSPVGSGDGTAAAAAAAADDWGVQEVSDDAGALHQHQQQQPDGADGQQLQQRDGSGSSGGGGAPGSGTPRLRGPTPHRRSVSAVPSLLGCGATGAQSRLALKGDASDHVPVPIGIITIEDVIEELISQEIVDETDLFVDNERSITVNAAALAQSLPAQLRLALAPQGGSGSGGNAAAAAARVTVRKLIRQRSSGSLNPAVIAAATAATPRASAGGQQAAQDGGGSGGMAAAVTAGLAAAAAAVSDGRRTAVGGDERQPLLSAAGAHSTAS